MTTMDSDSRPRTLRRAPKRETLKTWAFDSRGDRKYALQLQRASNGNPCLRIVLGTPQNDGSFRKFDITIWSEDFALLFENFDAMRAYVEANGITTPPDHSWTPHSKRSGPGR